MRYKRVLRRGERLVGSNLKRCYLLALEIHRVHHPLFNFLIRPKSPRLTQQLIHECGLAVIDVRNDGDVANVLIKTFSFVGQAHRLPKQVTATGAVALQQMRNAKYAQFSS